MRPRERRSRLSAPTSPQPIGILLAAGRGKRMNGRKQFHPWPTPAGTKHLVAASFDAIAAACSTMVVVLGHRADEVRAALAPREFDHCLADPDAPMFSSVQTGLRHALSLNEQADVLLHPGDHPEVAAATLEALAEERERHPDKVINPQYDGQGGHPVLIPNKIARELLETDCPQGLGQYWSEHAELCLRLEVDDASIVRDVDRV